MMPGNHRQSGPPRGSFPIARWRVGRGLMLAVALGLGAAVPGPAQEPAPAAPQPAEAKALTVLYSVAYPNGVKPKVVNDCYDRAVLTLAPPQVFIAPITEGGITIPIVSGDAMETIAELHSINKTAISTKRNDAPVGFNYATAATHRSRAVLGHACDEIRVTATCTVSNLVLTYTLWLSRDLLNDGKNYTRYPGLEGVILAQDLDYGDGCLQRWEATEILETPLDPSLFQVPADYTVLSQADFTRKFMKDRKFRKSFDAESKLTREARWSIFLKAVLDVAQSNVKVGSSPAGQALLQGVKVLKSAVPGAGSGQ